MPISDPRDGFFDPSLILVIDSYSPIYVIFNFDKYTQLYFKGTFCKYDDGNYDLLKQYVRDFD